MSAVTASAVFTAGRVQLVDEFTYRACIKRAGKKWGEGAALVVRVEPEEDAQTHGQRKHYFGHVVTPLSEWNGDFLSDWHLLLKSMFMPDGKTSLTQLNYDEMREYIQQCEVYAHTTHPDAFALYDRRSA